MFGKIPLKQTKQTPVREQKQPSTLQIKKQGPSGKQILKPNNPPVSKTPSKKQNIPQEEAKSIKLLQKTVQQKLSTKVQITTNRSIKPSAKFKPTISMMSQVKQQLYPCKQCGRTFNDNALKRHQKICKKIFINKRKEFNSAKQRFASKDQLNLYKKNKDKFDQKTQKVTQMPIWKQQSLAFRLAMKQVKGGEKTKQQLQYLQKEKKIIKSSMFNCKFCKRSFNEEAGKRHEAFCAQKAKDMSYKAKRK